MFGFFKEKIENFKQAVSNTAQSLVGNVLSNVDATDEQYSEFALDDIEDTLISADLGVDYAVELVDNLRKKKNAKPSELKNYLKDEFKQTLLNAGSTELNYKDGDINIYFIAGVNGAGKTTLIAKMAYNFKQQGKKVL
jgi:fused signal recognition particle receptor